MSYAEERAETMLRVPAHEMLLIVWEGRMPPNAGDLYLRTKEEMDKDRSAFFRQWTAIEARYQGQLAEWAKRDKRVAELEEEVEGLKEQLVELQKHGPVASRDEKEESLLEMIDRLRAEHDGAE